MAVEMNEVGIEVRFRGLQADQQAVDPTELLSMLTITRRDEEDTGYGYSTTAGFIQVDVASLADRGVEELQIIVHPCPSPESPIEVDVTPSRDPFLMGLDAAAKVIQETAKQSEKQTFSVRKLAIFEADPQATFAEHLKQLNVPPNLIEKLEQGKKGFLNPTEVQETASLFAEHLKLLTSRALKLTEDQRRLLYNLQELGWSNEQLRERLFALMAYNDRVTAVCWVVPDIAHDYANAIAAAEKGKCYQCHEFSGIHTCVKCGCCFCTGCYIEHVRPEDKESPEFQLNEVTPTQMAAQLEHWIRRNGRKPTSRSLVVGH